MSSVEPMVLGCDFSSSPHPRKPIFIALGRLQSKRVRLLELRSFADLQAWGQWLAQLGVRPGLKVVNTTAFSTNPLIQFLV